MNTFEYEHTVTMGDVNAMGNYYFLNYFSLQGHVRELWLSQRVNNLNFILNNYMLSTKTAHCDYVKPFFLYEGIVIKMYATELQRVSVKLNFDYFIKGKNVVYASGYQIVVCKNKERKTCRFPSELLEALENLT